MGIKVSIEHRTTYTFDRRVSLGPHSVRLRPAPHSRTPIEAYSMTVVPEEHFLNWQQDPFGNHVARLVFPEKSDRLEVVIGLIADLTGDQPVRLLRRGVGRALPVPVRRPGGRPGALPAQRARARRPSHPRPAGPTPGRAARGPGGSPDRRPALARQQDGPRRGRLHHPPGAGRADPRRDAADRHRLLPRLGLAAGQRAARARPRGPLRLRLPRPARRRPGEPRRPQRPDRRLHRPARLDRGLRARRRLDRARPHLGAVRRRGPHPALRDAAPHQRRRRSPAWSTRASRPSTSPTSSPASTRTRGSPCPTPPTSGTGSTHVGEPVDERLAAGDVRLTMGGEPTFVSIDDMESEQWNTDADGPHKRELATDLARRLRERLRPRRRRPACPGQVVPGRAAAALADRALWRTDGVPLWQHPTLLADPWADGPTPPPAERRHASQR